MSLKPHVDECTKANIRREARQHSAIISPKVLPNFPKGGRAPSLGMSTAAPQGWRMLAGLLGLNTCSQQPSVLSSSACPFHGQKHVTASHLFSSADFELQGICPEFYLKNVICIFLRSIFISVCYLLCYVANITFGEHL